ncbi:pavine N-methyltransferase [Ziziphus jujuba]|uniref:Pavine N-methyltransferase n=1 Tax=Ziziphus jujuba TaxID=326968 RepID=A0ABM3IRX4_ZIZJJ|nr:pavine N-methyltransferase [Ziziphus jujuba]
MFRILGMLRDAIMGMLIGLLEQDLLPDVVIRRIIRVFLASRLLHGYKPTRELQLSQLVEFAKSLKEMPISMNTGKPEADVYELPTSFFEIVLGKNLKFSASYFPDKSSKLEDAEKATLELYCKRAQIKDGQTILDIGCGWGSLTLHIAKSYNNCKITGLTDSSTQKAYVDERCRELQIHNVEIIVGDISTFEMEATYDRLVSVELFEYMKNYKDLLKKISKWMKEDGLLFVEHYCHKIFAHHFEVSEWLRKYDWLNKNLFSAGGVMLSADLLLYFQDDVSVVDHWVINGKHFSKTGEEWLKRMDKNLPAIKQMMESTYGKDSAVKWTVYWRTFFLFIAENYGYNNGEEWMVAHFLFKKK